MASVSFIPQEGILVVILSGEITLLDSNEIKEKIKDEQKNSNANKLVLDFSQVPLIDSSGLGMLISLFKHINQQQGTIIYEGLTPYVKKIINFAKLDQIFTIVDDLETAKKILNN